jgi:glyoxylase-like metal-dependent hydrolase (beta-lactamase superfamily II)
VSVKKEERAFLCTACGTQFPPADEAPTACPICQDERQYVPESGQKWTDLEELRRGFANYVEQKEERLFTIVTRPHFAIGQQAYLAVTPKGNVLWDCVSLIDDATVATIAALGGVSAIAISHPHYYTTMVEWSRAFGDAPVYLHQADSQWVMRPDPCLRFWNSEVLPLHDGITLVRCGGHFSGGTVLHWGRTASRPGLLLSADIFQVVPDSRWLSFMYSFPNYIPLNAKTVRSMVAAVDDRQFEKIYGAFGHVVKSDGNGALQRSVERYVRAIA